MNFYSAVSTLCGVQIITHFPEKKTYSEQKVFVAHGSDF